MTRRTLATLVCTAVAGLAIAPSAGAAEAGDLESYGAGSSATALVLSLLDQELTVSGTGAAVGSTPSASADGQSLSTPLFSTPGSSVESSGATVTGEDCAVDEALPAPIDLAGAEIACVRTSAGVANGVPDASSLSDEIVLDITSAELVGTASEAVLRPLLEQLLAGLEPLLAQLDPVGPTLDTVIDLLLDDLEDGGSLATITVAPTSSTATAVSSEATSQGAVVDLLPGLLPGIGSMATITVGDAFATAEVDPATGEVTLDGKAAFLDVDLTGLELVLNALLAQVGATVTSQLPQPLDQVMQGVVDQIVALVTDLDDEVESTVNVTVDQLACPDSPLAAVVCFSAGGVNELDGAGLESFGFTYGAGTRGIEAEMLGLSVLDGVLALSVGQAAAGANGVVADPDAPTSTTSPEDPSRSLPRTGGDTPLPLAILLLGAAATGLAVLRRTRQA